MVKRVFSLVYREIKGLHQAAYLLAFFAFGSQMLGLVRDRLLAHTFGAGSELDLYYAAFRIPDVLFALFASVLSVYVLLPFVLEARASDKSDQTGARLLSQCFTWFLYVYGAIALILFAITPWLVPILFPGLAAEHDVLTLLIRILLLQPFLLGVSSLFGVVTQLSRRFVLYALSPLLYNIGIIIGIVFLYPIVGMSGLVLGVICGALAHLLVQVPLVHQSTLAFSAMSEFSFASMRPILRFALPRAITLSLHQVVLLVLIGMATLMATGSVAVFQFAFNLQSVPLAIIGMSYSVAAFPVLAELFAKKEHTAFVTHLTTAIRHILFWSLPLIALIIVLRAHIVRVVLGSGEFTWSDTRLTAALLAIFISALAVQSLLLLLTRAFYASGNALVPLKIACLGAGSTILTALFLFISPEAAGIRGFVEGLFRVSEVPGTEVLLLAAVFVGGLFLELLLLLYAMKRMLDFSLRFLLRPLSESVLAGAVAGIASYTTLSFVNEGVNQATFIGILLQGGVAAGMGCVGALLVYQLTKSKTLEEIYQSFRVKILKTDVIGPQTDTP